MTDTTTSPVYESTFGIAMLDLEVFVAQARAISHDAVIASTGRARRSGVRWSHYPLAEWRAAMAELGIDVPEDRPRTPADLEVLAAQYPAGVLVVATVEVDPGVEP